MEQHPSHERQRPERRDAHDRRSGPIRMRQRRRKSEPVAAERRSVERRSRDRRRTSAPAPPPARDPVWVQQFLDEVIAARGDTLQRLAKAVRRHWPTYPPPVRTGMVAELLPLVEPLVTAGEPVTPEVRNRADAVIADWQARVRRRSSRPSG